MAAVEAVVFALVFSRVMGDLGSWHRVVGYAAGVAVGTAAGLVVSDRISPGGVVVEVVVAGDGTALREAFHACGWPATAIPAAGVSGEATLLFLAVDRQETDEVLDLVRATAPDAFWTTRPASALHAPAGVAPAAVC